MERYERLLILLLALAITVPLIIKSRRTAPQAVPAAFSVSAPFGYVGVSGSVHHPGTYPITANMMTVDAIKLAEPVRRISRTEPARFADQPVKSGEVLQVRFDGAGTLHVTRGTIPVAQRLILGIPLDLNRITVAELEQVPGIGPSMAADIVMLRQKNGGKLAVGDLEQLPGIGEKKFLSVKKYFKHIEN